jgi:hypothetical protein
MCRILFPLSKYRADPEWAVALSPQDVETEPFPQVGCAIFWLKKKFLIEAEGVNQRAIFSCTRGNGRPTAPLPVSVAAAGSACIVSAEEIFAPSTLDL